MDYDRRLSYVEVRIDSTTLLAAGHTVGPSLARTPTFGSARPTSTARSPASMDDFLVGGSSRGAVREPAAGVGVEPVTTVSAPPAVTAPAVPVPTASSPAVIAPAKADPRIVEFLFATTRRLTGVAERVASYTGERGTSIRYGAARVRIPEDHKIGHIELAQGYKLFGIRITNPTPNEKNHFIIQQLRIVPEATWGEIIKARGAKHALVFVHGYNNSFEDAVYRTAQIVWDLQYAGTAVLFSWPSRGNVLDYPYDQASAYGARDHFVSVLRKLKEEHGVENVHVLAHSMGNVVVLDALAHYARTTNPVRVAELIMAAPDVDRDQFMGLVPEVRKIASGLTLYATSADKALIASRRFAGAPRAGDVPQDGPIVLPGLETIDVTAIGDEMLGLNHNVFAAVRSLINDIKRVIDTGQRPPHARLPEIRGYPEAGEPKYWRYAR